MIPCSATTVGQAVSQNQTRTTCIDTPTASMAVDGGRNWNGANSTDPDTFSAYPALSTQPAREAAQVPAQRLAEQGIAVNSSVEQERFPKAPVPFDRAFRIAE